MRQAPKQPESMIENLGRAAGAPLRVDIYFEGGKQCGGDTRITDIQFEAMRSEP
jgi:hypothetical protein